MKKAIACLLSVCLLFGWTGTVWAAQEITITISVYERVNGSYLYGPASMTLEEGATALDALRKTGLPIEMGDANFVLKIGDYENGTHGLNSGWLYYINGGFLSTGAGNYSMQDGETLEWIYAVDEQDVTAAPTTAPTVAVPAPQPSQPTSVTEATQLSQPPSESGPQTQTQTQTQTTTGQQLIETAAPTTRSQSELISRALDYLKDHNGSFTVLTLSLYSQAIPRTLKNNLLDEARQSNLSAIDLQRLIINLDACGVDFTDIDGVNLQEQCFNHTQLMAGGINGVIFALLALEHCTLDGTETYNADSLVNLLLQNQKDDGSFALNFDMDSDVDITAMAVSALANYTGRAAVTAAIDRALVWLSEQQNADGSYSNCYGESCCESTAQVMIALAAMQIDRNDSRFVKSGYTTADALARFASEDGYAHMLGGATDTIATEQALLALYADANTANPYTIEITNHIEEIDFPLIILIAAGVVLVCGVALYILTRNKRKGRGQQDMAAPAQPDRAAAEQLYDQQAGTQPSAREQAPDQKQPPDQKYAPAEPENTTQDPATPADGQDANKHDDTQHDEQSGL